MEKPLNRDLFFKTPRQVQLGKNKKPLFEDDDVKDSSIKSAIPHVSVRDPTLKLPEFKYFKIYTPQDYSTDDKFLRMVYQMMFVLIPYFVWIISAQTIDFESLILYFLTSTTKGQLLLKRINEYFFKGNMQDTHLVFKAICDAPMSIGAYGNFVESLERSVRTDDMYIKKAARYNLPSRSVMEKHSAKLRRNISSGETYWSILCDSAKLNDKSYRYATLQNAELFLCCFIRYHEKFTGKLISAKIRCTVDGTAIDGANTGYDIVLIHPNINPFYATNYFSLIIAEPKEEIAFQLKIWNFSHQLLKITMLNYQVANETPRQLPIQFITNPDKGAFSKIIEAPIIKQCCTPIFHLVNLYCLLALIFKCDKDLILSLVPKIRKLINSKEKAENVEGESKLDSIMKLKEEMPTTLPILPTHTTINEKNILDNFQLNEQSRNHITNHLCNSEPCHSSLFICMFCYLTKETKRIALKYPDLCVWGWLRNDEAVTNVLGWKRHNLSWCLSHDIRACGQALIEHEVGQDLSQREYFLKLFGPNSPIECLRQPSAEAAKKLLHPKIVKSFKFVDWSQFDLKIKEKKPKNKSGQELKKGSTKYTFDQILFKQIDKIIMTIDIWHPHWVEYLKEKKNTSTTNRESFQQRTNKEHEKQGTNHVQDYSELWKCLQKAYVKLRSEKSKWEKWKKNNYSKPLDVFKQLGILWMKYIPVGAISDYFHIHIHAGVVFDIIDESFVTTSNIGSESKNALRRKRHNNFGVNNGPRFPCDDSLYYDSKILLNNLEIMDKLIPITEIENEKKRKDKLENLTRHSKKSKPNPSSQNPPTPHQNPIPPTNSSIPSQSSHNPIFLQPQIPANIIPSYIPYQSQSFIPTPFPSFPSQLPFFQSTPSIFNPSNPFSPSQFPNPSFDNFNTFPTNNSPLILNNSQTSPNPTSQNPSSDPLDFDFDF